MSDLLRPDWPKRPAQVLNARDRTRAPPCTQQTAGNRGHRVGVVAGLDCGAQRALQVTARHRVGNWGLPDGRGRALERGEGTLVRRERVRRLRLGDVEPFRPLVDALVG